MTSPELFNRLLDQPLMIYREKILAALESRRVDFANFETKLREQYAVYAKALDDFNSIDTAKLAEFESPGALPTGEIDSASSFVIPFGHSRGGLTI